MNYTNNLKVFSKVDELTEKLAQEFINIYQNRENNKFTVSLAGGGTPKTFYKKLAQSSFNNQVDWSQVHFFWGDERCVPPDHQDSNYKMVQESLFQHISIPPENIHRVRGENNPNSEVQRYADIIDNFVEKKNNLPAFDFMLLGLGTDGHTASLFPNSSNLVNQTDYCSLATHPDSGQIRITINLPLITNSYNIYFMVTGKRKAEIMTQLFGKNIVSSEFPASLVKKQAANTNWFLDQAAASLLDNY